MDWPKDCHNEWCKSDREGKMSYNSHLYVGSKKKKKLYKWTYLQNRKRLTDLENEPMVACTHCYI